VNAEFLAHVHSSDVSVYTKQHIYFNKQISAVQYNIKKGTVFTYLLPSVGPRADPGVQEISPHVTF